MINQILIIRKDLRISKGRIIELCSHASMIFLSYLYTSKPYKEKLKSLGYIKEVEEWLNEKIQPICFYVENEDELLDIYEQASFEKLIVHIVKNKNRLNFICLAIGPHNEKKFEKIIRKLKLYD
jgi:peptidyl-tRNA hydrolase